MDEVKVNQGPVQYIKVQLDKELYGVDIDIIDNIVRPQNVTRVPNVPEYIKGVINIRGEIVPIMSIRLKMDLPEDEITKNTRFIIIKTEQYGKIGMIVDCVKEVITLESSDIEPINHSSKDAGVQYVTAVGKTGDTLVSLLDINAVLLDKNAKEE
ncbi:MAG: chemotaxis protein CheW [Lachnospiraceae bacterium]|nr:chemotaxis protein CheW [Lachnospiraceae bacterium]